MPQFYYNIQFLRPAPNPYPAMGAGTLTFNSLAPGGQYYQAWNALNYNFIFNPPTGVHYEFNLLNTIKGGGVLFDNNGTLLEISAPNQPANPPPYATLTASLGGNNPLLRVYYVTPNYPMIPPPANAWILTGARGVLGQGTIQFDGPHPKL